MSRTPPNAANARMGTVRPAGPPTTAVSHRFFIDWFACPHPAQTSPSVGALLTVRIALPDPVPLQTLMAELGIDDSVGVAVGEPELTIAFDTRHGAVTYSGRSPAGFTLDR